MCSRLLALGSAAALLFWAGGAIAQSVPVTGSLERFQPSVPGDALLGVPSPATAGHLVPRATITGNYAYRPLSIQDGDERKVIVSDQFFLHLAASFALFDRVLVSADMPFVLAQGGESPEVSGFAFQSPASAEAGDLRLGARLRIYGGPWEPFQIGVGGSVFVPTAPSGSYAGDGAVRGEPHLLAGGRTEHIVYSLSLGATLKGSSRPHTFDARAGAALVLFDSLLQVGPEAYVSAPLSRDVVVDTEQTTIAIASPVSAELLLGVKLRFFKSWVIGAGAGPGLSQGWGTPVFLATGLIGYDPLPLRQAAQDRDGDSISDSEDACPDTPGEENADPKKNGCPPDRDGDTIFDKEDACPQEPGIRSEDPQKNGCPAPTDTDGDSILDKEDACPKVAGEKNADPKKNGCPPDSDEDGITDKEDACPKEPGIQSEDPQKNGCPDGDGDGVIDKLDACPQERGGPDPDPKKNGCPHVEVTKTEIVILRQVQFRFGKSRIDQTVDPVSDDLLTEVRDAILRHPEIKLIEVQGHADNVGQEEYNQSLSQSRSDAVKDWLIKRGVAPEKLVSKGYGSKVPRADNDTESGRQQNRRVQFLIVKQDPR